MNFLRAGYLRFGNGLALSLFLLFPGAVVHADTIHHGQSLATGLMQLNGLDLKIGDKTHAIAELADPAPPFYNDDGSIEIYGSANYFMRYANWAAFDQAGNYSIIPLDLRYPDGHPILSDNTPWDLRKYSIVSHTRQASSGGSFLAGATMTPSPGSTKPKWPEDNINRRIYRFYDSAHAWYRSPHPLVGSLNSGWIEHSYGGNFFQGGQLDQNRLDLSSKRPIYFFYERVSDARNNSPYITDLFVRKVSAAEINLAQPLRSAERSVLTVGDPPLNATHRTIGGYLIEGPRPVEIKIGKRSFYFVFFSAGDFPTDTYTISYAWAKTPDGPYQPATVRGPNGKMDLLDLGTPLKRKYNLSFVGRPVVFPTPNGKYEMLFHGVKKDILPGNDYRRWPTADYPLDSFFRCLFKADLKISLSDSASPRIDIDTHP